MLKASRRLLDLLEDMSRVDMIGHQHVGMLIDWIDHSLNVMGYKDDVRGVFDVCTTVNNELETDRISNSLGVRFSRFNKMDILEAKHRLIGILLAPHSAKAHIRRERGRYEEATQYEKGALHVAEFMDKKGYFPGDVLE